jgi:uncharacterized protein YlxP (DUF503 family)
MVIGVLTLELFLSESSSLKCKRKIIKSLLDKVKFRFNLAVAEIDKQDQWKHSVVGMACITNDVSHAHQMLSTVIKFIEHQGTVEILDIRTEML